MGTINILICCCFLFPILQLFIFANSIENESAASKIASPLLTLTPAEATDGRTRSLEVEESLHEVQPEPAQISWQTGSVWPLPQKIHYGGNELNEGDCDILEHAKSTFVKRWLLPFTRGDAISESNFAESIQLVVQMRKHCPEKSQFPTSKMDEEYRLNVPFAGDVVLEANEIWGILRGLETFSQLFFQQNGQYLLRTATIHDWPEYPVRGILIDTSRHYLKKNLLLRQIDLMAMNKMNTFHWHIVDMESFPYVSRLFPNISEKGAFSPRHVYTPEVLQEILSYARLRGIRVIPEFDTPGHMQSWRGAGVMASCHDDFGKALPPSMLDPSEESTYVFLKEFLGEVMDTFKDNYLHLGGDEASFWTSQCWGNNAKIKEFMLKKDFHNITQLENYYIQRLQSIVKQLFAERAADEQPRKMIFWQEVFDNNKPDPSNTIVHNWYSKTNEERFRDTKRAVERGFDVLVSSCWYLNYISYGPDWRAGTGPAKEIYYCDPRGFEGTYEEKQRVIGGIATMWGEYVDATNVESRTW
uniref:Beta-hexosaminidase n=1 Tax=Globodera pallida TaxID=36090 RepID=A0A183C880_GLOPA